MRDGCTRVCGRLRWVPHRPNANGLHGVAAGRPRPSCGAPRPSGCPPPPMAPSSLADLPAAAAGALLNTPASAALTSDTTRTATRLATMPSRRWRRRRWGPRDGRQGIKVSVSRSRPRTKRASSVSSDARSTGGAPRSSQIACGTSPGPVRTRARGTPRPDARFPYPRQRRLSADSALSSCARFSRSARMAGPGRPAMDAGLDRSRCDGLHDPSNRPACPLCREYAAPFATASAMVQDWRHEPSECQRHRLLHQGAARAGQDLASPAGTVGWHLEPVPQPD